VSVAEFYHDFELSCFEVSTAAAGCCGDKASSFS
jgi:hypothetical protein